MVCMDLEAITASGDSSPTGSTRTGSGGDRSVPHHTETYIHGIIAILIIIMHHTITPLAIIRHTVYRSPPFKVRPPMRRPRATLAAIGCGSRKRAVMIGCRVPVHQRADRLPRDQINSGPQGGRPACEESRKV